MDQRSAIASSPRVSVLLPVFQAEATLEEALAGVLGGTLVEIEVLAVDDGSSDRSPEILLRLAREDRRLRFIAAPHRGIAPTLAAALEAACAPLVARLDADDVSHPDRLRRQAEALSAHPDWAGLGCRVSWLGGGATAGMRRYLRWQNGLVEPEEIRRGMFVEAPLTHATLLLRREALIAAGGYRACAWSEDYDLLLRLLLGGHRLGKLAEELYAWRERPGRLTRTAAHCTAESFHRARAHYLTGRVLAGQARVALWGVGELGRRWRLSLEQAGLAVDFTPLNPRRIKGARGGRVVVPPENLPPPGGGVTLFACGTQSNRDLVRAAAAAAGLAEGENFWCLG
jgi:glycosyltransferase involved in cell wall biosynthesis